MLYTAEPDTFRLQMATYGVGGGGAGDGYNVRHAKRPGLPWYGVFGGIRGIMFRFVYFGEIPVEVSLLGVGTVLGLESDAGSIVK